MQVQTTVENVEPVSVEARHEYHRQVELALLLVESGGFEDAIRYCEDSGMEDTLDVLFDLCTAGAFTVH